MPVFNVKVGTAELKRVEELTCKMPLAMFGADDLVARSRHWMLPAYADADDNWEMVFQSWLVVVDGKVILVDPCTGNGRSFPDFPLAHMLDTPFIERLRATGFRPEDIDYVFCTHLHMDHCGWNTQLRDGRFVPTFPNARYVMVRREFDRWDPSRPGHQISLPNVGVFENSVLPVLEAGLAEIVDDTHQMTQSLSIQPAYGHTAGHSSLHLRSEGEDAWFTGDAFHHPIELAHPEIDCNTCEDFDATLATRRRLIAACLATDALLVPAHFAAPYVGRLHEVDGEVRFKPLAI